ncbi:Hypothetical protein A7982_11049 [Minicystis rosea]|nr:Hypothetical protein A7982_11049 [Minicystis rosea]
MTHVARIARHCAPLSTRAAAARGRACGPGPSKPTASSRPTPPAVALVTRRAT